MTQKIVRYLYHGFLAVSILLINSSHTSAANCNKLAVSLFSHESKILIPTTKTTLKNYREVYREHTLTKLSELEKLIKQANPDIVQIGASRKFFVLFRHFSELFTKQGSLPANLEFIAKKSGKFVDAIKASKNKKAFSIKQELLKHINKIKKSGLDADLATIKIAKRKKVEFRIKESIAKVKGAIQQSQLSSEEFHNLKKSVRRLTSIVRFRSDILKQTHLKTLADDHQRVIDLLGETTDEIARLKLSLSTKELEKKIFPLTGHIKAEIKDLLNSIEVVAVL